MYYDQLKRRIKLLQGRRGGKVNVTLLYKNGKEVTVGGLEAVEKIINDHTIVDIKCQDGSEQSLLCAMLQAEQECGGSFDNIEELEEGEESG